MLTRQIQICSPRGQVLPLLALCLEHCCYPTGRRLPGGRQGTPLQSSKEIYLLRLRVWEQSPTLRASPKILIVSPCPCCLPSHQVAKRSEIKRGLGEGQASGPPIPKGLTSQSPSPGSCLKDGLRFLGSSELQELSPAVLTWFCWE